MHERPIINIGDWAEGDNFRMSTFNKIYDGLTGNFPVYPTPNIRTVSLSKNLTSFYLKLFHILLPLKVYLLYFHRIVPVSYTHLRAHETDSYLVCRLLLEKK